MLQSAESNQIGKLFQDRPKVLLSSILTLDTNYSILSTRFLFSKNGWIIASLLQEQRCTEELLKVLYRLVLKSTTVWVQITSRQQEGKSKFFYDGLVLPLLQIFL